MDVLWNRAKLTMRPARCSDFSSIRSIAISSFRKPRNWHSVAENLQRYEQEYPAINDFGSLHSIIALNDCGNICAYAFYQLREDGTNYLKEIASNPQSSREKRPYAGVCLVGFSLAAGLALGFAETCALNVTPKCRFSPDFRLRGRVRDLVTYYQRLGYLVDHHHNSCDADGNLFAPGNLWMSGHVENCLDAIQFYLSKRLSTQFYSKA